MNLGAISNEQEVIKLKPSFAGRIREMNQMYRLPVNDFPLMPRDAVLKLQNFKKTLTGEVIEINEVIDAANDSVPELIVLTMMADLLGDIMVYCRSEALKYGIPLEAVLDIIMDSNSSKLGADGQPIYNEEGKFLKGPNYWKPERKIAALLYSCGNIDLAKDHKLPDYVDTFFPETVKK